MAGFVDDDKQLRSYATVIPELGDFRGIRSPARWYVFNNIKDSWEMLHVLLTFSK